MIHPQALIDREVSLGSDVEIGAFVRLEKNVRLGDGVRISPFVHIIGDVEIGDDTFIGTGAVIGEAAQMKGSTARLGCVRIGQRNIIREYVTIHAPSQENGITSLGDDNFLMALSHVAHDCRIANSVIICNGVLLAGHIEVADGAFISGNAAVHQFVRIGSRAMIAGLARVTNDVPPFMMVAGNSRVWGVNLVGLKRAGFSKEDISQIKAAHALLFCKSIPLKIALDRLSQASSEPVRQIASFIAASQRGICGPKRSSLKDKIFFEYPCFFQAMLYARRLFRHRERA